MKKRTIIVTHYKVVSWVYTRIIPMLRERLNANILLVLPSGVQLPESYRRVMDEHDEIVYVQPFADLDGTQDCTHVTGEDCRQIEINYNCNLYSDVLLQERVIAQKTMIGSQSSAAKNAQNKKSSWLGVCKFYFEFFENLFDERDICLALVWPRSSWEAVIGVVSCRRNILVTYPYTSKGEGTLVCWADGMFANAAELRQKYAKQTATQIYNIENRVAPGRPDKFTHNRLSSHYGLYQFLRRILLIVFNWFVHRIKDLSKGRYGQRKNPIKSIFDEINSLIYWKKFSRLCVKAPRLGTSKRYALYTFQNEPEFSVQGRCKEFFDQQAIILSIADSMPSDSVLFIKEHAWVGHRTLQYYEELLRHPNIEMLSPAVPATELVPNSKFVASLNGTVIFEAAAFGVPAAYFSKRSEFSVLANSSYLTDLVELKNWVAKIMRDSNSEYKKEYKISATRYMNVVKEISFDGVPLYKEGSGEIENEQLERSLNLLMQKIDLFNQDSSMFDFR